MIKRKTLLFLVLIQGLLFSFAQDRGQVKESLSLPSKVLQKEMAYSIYLPAGYAQSQRSYPVLYLLHGRTGNEKDWIHYGLLESQIDQALNAKQLPPMIIVMPQAFDSYYLDSYDDALPYEKYFFEEFIPFIEQTYRVRASREFRAIAGLSMGGYGALHYAMRHPDMFIGCGAMSAAVYSDKAMSSMNQERYDNIYGPLYGMGEVGEARLSDTWKAYSSFYLLKKTPESELKKIKWYIDCGDDDYLNIGNTLLHLQMLEQQIPHEFRVYDGAHNWTYWRMALIPCLRYICRDFAR
jgi:enterochelin esterase-like enzyme